MAVKHDKAEQNEVVTEIGSIKSDFYDKTRIWSASVKGLLIGRNKAVVDLSFLKISGIIAWFNWVFLHLVLLVAFSNRLIVFSNWSWNYFTYDKGSLFKRFKGRLTIKVD